MSNPIIYVVSDSVGETAELVAKATISQFSCVADIRKVSYVEDEGTLKEVISIAKINNGIICFTLVKPDMRKYLIEECDKAGVLVHDVMGPLLDKLMENYQLLPRYEPRILRKLDNDYFKKIEAIEFAVKYDDGRDPRGILKADIVLVGVSRTSKTPLSQYLAHKQFKVANVPLVPEVDPPDELFQVPKERCFGLKITPDKLNDIRRERLKSLGLDDRATYANIQRIEQELIHFEKVVTKIGCNVIDVSTKAVEETANLILGSLHHSK